MDRRISDNEIKYLLDHLAVFYHGTRLASYLSTGEKTRATGEPGKGRIIIPLSGQALSTNKILSIDQVPVLFSCSKDEKWYTTEGKNIRFHHDILKSAFYLLSGYQEYVSKEVDEHGRYPWTASVQFRLGFTAKPLVNYYFEVIIDAYEAFCKLNSLSFERVKKSSPVLFLSHDVDRIQKYSLRDMVFVGLQLPGIKSNTFTLAKRLKNIREIFLGTLLFREDPYWNFTAMLRQEKKLDIRSSWYFLEKTRKENSRYHFHHHKIRDLIGKISGEGHEIGIHGTLESSGEQQAMKSGISRLNDVCETPVKGIRQHYLSYTNPLTTKLQQASELDYDASLGFAEMVGFRNSFALPFRLYDFDLDCPSDIWQIPLNVMDVTLTGYMGIPLPDLWSAIGPLVDEVVRFNGVLSLLWHNCRLDEEETPGINDAYQMVLEKILDSGFVSMTGNQVIEAFKTSCVSGRNLLV